MANKNSVPWLKWLFILAVIGGAVGGGFWYFKNRHEVIVEFQSMTASKGDLTQAVTATGGLGPVLNVAVGSQISGIVKKLYIDYNSTVKSNQVIAEIDSSTYQINVLRAEAQVANSKANLALSQIQARRAVDLFANHLISESDHDIAKAQLLQAQAQVQSDEASLKNAQVQLSYCTIYAPVDGVVISRSVDVGQTVAASFNTPTVAVIANDLTKMQIDALVSEADIGGVAVGQDVNFSVDAYPYRTFRGKVGQIRYGAITNQNVINYDCVVQVNNSDLKLLPGMTANVSIILAERNSVIKIPNSAFRFKPPEAAGSKTNALSGTSTNSTERPRQAMGDAAASGPRGPGMGSGGGGQGGGRRGDRGPGMEGGGGRGRSERASNRTIYVLPATKDPKDTPKPTPVQIKVGISDGISTEVLEGLEEGAQVLTGTITTGDTATARPAGGSSNPFGGGGGFGGGGFRPRF
ncbi:MAG: efflux RND transporter periplasmic adaptor subunit [Verrucomicrobiota bacterium]